MKRLVGGESGVAMIMVLAFIALAGAAVPASLAVASSLAVDSRVKTEILKEQYAAIGADQYSTYRMLYEPGYTDTLVSGVPDTFTVTLNGIDVITSITMYASSTSNPPAGSSDNNRRLQTTKVASPTTALADTLTTYTYTITVENRSESAESINKVYDQLPAGMTYVTGSTSGMTVAEPSASGQQLEWNVVAEGINLAQGQSATLSFDVQGTLAEGLYCNEAWVTPGGPKTSTGKTAFITVGTPASPLCSGPAVTVTKTVDKPVVLADTFETFTYTITVDNIGTDGLNVDKVEDLLPAGFAYLAGSTTGNFTTSDPSTTLIQGRERLIWNFNPTVLVPSDTVSTLTFQATATAPPGIYPNEAWIVLTQFSNDAYTWPTAEVRAMGAYGTNATAGNTSVTGELWIGYDSYATTSWEISR